MSSLTFLITQAVPATPGHNLQKWGRIGIDYFEAMKKESKIQKAYTDRCLIIKHFWSYFRFTTRLFYISMPVPFSVKWEGLFSQMKSVRFLLYQRLIFS